MSAPDRLTRVGTWHRHHGPAEQSQWVFEPAAFDCVASRPGAGCPCAALRDRVRLCDEGDGLLACGLNPDARGKADHATGELAISRRGLTLLAGAVYGVPLALLLTGAAIGQALGGDGLAAIVAIAAALPGFMLLRSRRAALMARLEMSWQVHAGGSKMGAETDSAQPTREFWTT